jgi:hypothetical protein
VHTTAPSSARHTTASPLHADPAAASRSTLTTRPAEASHRAQSAHTTALPSWGTALGLLVVALIGGTALVRIRRSSR